MLKIIGVALLGLAMSIGFAQAKATRHVHHQITTTKHAHMHKGTAGKQVQKNAPPQKNAIPICVEGEQVSATCACGTDASGRPFMCQEGQWCRTLAHACMQ
jgi:hypothetical protein